MAGFKNNKYGTHVLPLYSGIGMCLDNMALLDIFYIIMEVSGKDDYIDFVVEYNPNILGGRKIEEFVNEYIRHIVAVIESYNI